MLNGLQPGAPIGLAHVNEHAVHIEDEDLWIEFAYEIVGGRLGFRQAYLSLQGEQM